MDILNKINELVLMGYTVSFKPYPFDLVCIKMTYDNYYHANHMLTIPCKVKAEYILLILDELRFKIEKMIYEEKMNDTD